MFKGNIQNNRMEGLENRHHECLFCGLIFPKVALVWKSSLKGDNMKRSKWWQKSPLMQWPYVLWLFQCNVYLINSIFQRQTVSCVCTPVPKGWTLLQVLPCSLLKKGPVLMKRDAICLEPALMAVLMFSCFCVAFKSSTSSCVYTYIHEKMWF